MFGERTRGDHGPSVAAALESRRTRGRILLVGADLGDRAVDIKLLDDRLQASCAIPCTVTRHGWEAVTVTALGHLEVQDDPAGPSEIRVAVTWAWVNHLSGPALEVTGTAYRAHPYELRPEEFHVRSRDPRNRWVQPRETLETGGADARPTRERWRTPFPHLGREAPGWRPAFSSDAVVGLA
jgi:hypothetical protein